MKIFTETTLLVLLRLAMGCIFSWAFLDKLFGLGFATQSDKAWLSGNSPTTGFLKFGTDGWFKPYYENLAGNPLVDWLFMMGLLLIGISLLLGICMKLAAYSGTTLMMLMLFAHFPPANNPLLDDHVIYALVMLLLMTKKGGDNFGFAKSWRKSSIVKQYPILE